MDAVPVTPLTIGVILALFGAVGMGFNYAIKWLDLRQKQAVSEAKIEADKAQMELTARVTHLEDQIKQLQDGRRAALQSIIEAMLVPSDADAVKKYLAFACKALS